MMFSQGVLFLYFVVLAISPTDLQVIIGIIRAFLFQKPGFYSAKAKHEREELLDIPSTGALCQRCRYDEANQPVTTAATRRSGKVYRTIRGLKAAAQEGCWLCQALLSSMKLWDPVDKKKRESLVEVWIRFDKERFTIVGPNDLPRIQIYFHKGESKRPVMVLYR